MPKGRDGSATFGEQPTENWDELFARVLESMPPMPETMTFTAAPWVVDAHREENKARADAGMPAMSWDDFAAAMLNSEQRSKLLVGDTAFRYAFRRMTNPRR